MCDVLIEALRPAHLEGFACTHPIAAIPDDQWGQALAFLHKGKVMAILGGWHNDGAVELGLLLSTEAFRYPVAMHKTALRILADTRRAGWNLRAWPMDLKGAEWLRRLGFDPTNSGAFERHA